MRADTAAEITRKLFTADPRERQRLFDQLEVIMGPSRAQHFAQLMERYHRHVTQAGVISTQSGPEPGGQ